MLERMKYVYEFFLYALAMFAAIIAGSLIVLHVVASLG